MSPVSLAVAQPSGATIDVAVTGLRSAHGNLLVCLTANPKFFPDCGKDPLSVKKLVSAKLTGDIHFSGVAPGTYAVALIHDENANNKLDTALFIPKEGFGFSRNPVVAMGPPKFSSAEFSVGAADMKLPVKMKYML
jgi:uncharacterized protein (DUF2141 family)